MRCATFAVPVMLGSDPGGFPISLTEFPMSFPLAEFCRIYHRVRLWKMVVTATIHVDAYEEAVSSEQILDSDEDTLDLQENYRVQDPVYLAEIGAAPYDRIRNDVALDEFDVAVKAWHSTFSMLAPANSETSPPFNRGYWTGSHDGAPGDVIPRLKVAFEYENLNPGVGTGISYIKLKIGSYDFDIDPSIGSTYATGTVTGLFAGHSMDYKWYLEKIGTGTPSLTDISIDFQPHEYFEFSDGVTPIYTSATGFQLTNPYTAGT